MFDPLVNFVMVLCLFISTENFLVLYHQS
jgi:hypothetical protein